MVVAALSTACGAPADNDAAGSPETPVSHTPGSGSTDPGRPGALRVEPHDDVIDVRATPFDRFKVRDGGRAVDLYFWSGVEECYGVDRVEVEYSRKVVSLTIFEGRDPDAETCIELAVRKVIRVELVENVANRAIVDGGASA